MITNRSAFPLTSVEATTRIACGGDIKTPKLEMIPVLMPGESHTWEKKMWIDGSVATEKNLTIVCDQGELTVR